MDIPEEGSPVDPWPLKTRSRPAENGTLPPQTLTTRHSPPHPDPCTGPDNGPVSPTCWSSRLLAASRRVLQPVKTVLLKAVFPSIAYRRQPDNDTNSTVTGEEGRGPKHAEREEEEVVTASSERMTPLPGLSLNCPQSSEATENKNHVLRKSQQNIESYDLLVQAVDNQTTPPSAGRRPDSIALESCFGQNLLDTPRNNPKTHLSDLQRKPAIKQHRKEDGCMNRAVTGRDPVGSHTCDSEPSAPGEACQCQRETEPRVTGANMFSTTTPSVCVEKETRCPVAGQVLSEYTSQTSSVLAEPTPSETSSATPFSDSGWNLSMPLPRSNLPLPQSNLPLAQSNLPLAQSNLPLPQSHLPLPQSHPMGDKTAITVSPVCKLADRPAVESYPVLTTFSCVKDTKDLTTKPAERQTTSTEVKSALFTEHKEVVDRGLTTEVDTQMLNGLPKNVTACVMHTPLTEDNTGVAAKASSKGTKQETQTSTSVKVTALACQVPDKEPTQMTKTFTTREGRKYASGLPVKMTKDMTHTSSVETDPDQTSGLPLKERPQLFQVGGEAVWSRMELTTGQSIRQTDLKLSVQSSLVVQSGTANGHPSGGLATPHVVSGHCPASMAPQSLDPESTSTDQQRPQSTSTGQQRPQSTSIDQQRPQFTSTGQQRPQSTSTGQQRPQSTSTGQQRPQSTSIGQQRLQSRTSLSQSKHTGATTDKPAHSPWARESAPDPHQAEDRMSRWFSVASFPPDHHVDPSPTLLKFDPTTCGEYHFLRDF